MRVFVTGASGWVGSAVVPELISAGHQVVGLARSASSADALTSIGASAHYGDLDNIEAIRSGAAESDGVIHLAYRHDIAFSSDPALAASTDMRAIQTVGSTLEGSDRPFIIATGLGGLPSDRTVTEQDGATPDRPGGQRAAASKVTLGFADRRVRASVVRLPPSVHGVGDTGFVPTMVSIARDKRVSAYVGNGNNRWPAVHRLDAARLFRLALESAPAGSVFHGVDDEGVALRDIAEVIGRHLDIAVSSLPSEDADPHFGGLSGLLSGDFPASSAITRRLLGWRPIQPNLLDDLDNGHYFA